MRVFSIALMFPLLIPLTARAASAPVRGGVIVADACQFLNELPSGDTATNGPVGGRGFGGMRGGRAGAATARASQPAVPFTFEDFSINMQTATPFSAKADIPQAGTWYLFVRSRAAQVGASFKVSVGGKLSPQTFGNGPVGRGVLQAGGSFDLPAGPLKITVTEIHPGDSFEAAFLTTKSTLTDADLPPLQYPDDIVLLKEYNLHIQVDGVKFGDLNGDGKTDLVVLTPNYSTYAFDNSGAPLWHYDAPQAGSTDRSQFEAPGNVWDFDQSGKADVIAWRMMDGKEWLVRLDGATGAIKYKTEWPTQPLPHVYNNFRTAIAKLHPGYPDDIIVYSDSGGEVAVNAYGPKLNLLWSYSHPRLKDYHGHYIYPVDIDGKGIDDVYVSHVMLDANGHEVWNNYDLFPDNHDHIDSARFIDLYGDGKLELVTGQSDVGTCVYDAKTGKLLWQRFANHNQKIEAGFYRNDVPGPQVVASSRFYTNGLGALLRWYDTKGNRISFWPFNPIPGNPNFVKGDFKGDGKNMLFWQRFRIEPDGTGTLAFPDEAFHMFDFMGTGNAQVITLGRNGVVRVYGYKDAQQHAPNRDPVYLAHSVSNHTHY